MAKEYPNKIAHVLNSPADIKAPHELTPAFFGCYDWHSAVHGHWLLASLARRFPAEAFAREAVVALRKNINPANIAGEVAYLNGPGRETFERPYGTAFAFGMTLDYARAAGDMKLEGLLVTKIREFHTRDRNCPISYEPSGQDFLSPCLAEADVMRRVLPPQEFATWLTGFLPAIPSRGRALNTTASAAWLPIGVVTDKSDGKLAHLDGLNLSRAWMLNGIASGLPRTDARRAALAAAAKAHADSGLAAVTGEHYEGGHWLGSFATYLLTR